MKAKLLAHCLQVSETKVSSLEEELDSTRQSVQSESKSTAGDKHETGRAMMHLEQEKLHQQLGEAKVVLAELQQIKANHSNTVIGLGSLVTTNKGLFFFAAGLGKVDLDGQTVFVVSTKAPIAKQFVGKQIGEQVNMNGTVYDIQVVQ